MGRPKRDDFDEKTRRALALRANHRCSFPGCGIPTSGPSEESLSAVTIIGVAAHIHAAAPGGRRYLAEMTPAQRSDISNGIWLCANHATAIDRDEVTYTADILREMKANHEHKISAEVAGSSTDLIALGPDLVFTGELIGSAGLEWRLRIDHFLIGDLSTLIRFSERFAGLDAYDRFVLVNALGDGRQLSAPPAWRKTEMGHEITCQVNEGFPRIDANRLPRDIALSPGHDFFPDGNGDIATVSGLAALPQKIQMCLSIQRGEMLFSPTFGSRIQEYFDKFRESLWLQRMIKLEVIRLACLPYNDSILSQQHTPLLCVQRVLEVEQLPLAQAGDWLPFRFHLDVEGVGPWQRDISIFIKARS